MKIEQVKAVVEIYRCAALHGHSATPEQIHKLMLLSARIKRLTADGLTNMSERRGRAYDRTMWEADVTAIHIGARCVKRNRGLVIVWPKCDDTIL